MPHTWSWTHPSSAVYSRGGSPGAIRHVTRDGRYEIFAEGGGNAFGIAVYGTGGRVPISRLAIRGNEVHPLKTGSSESVVVNGNVTDFRIDHNVIHDNNNIGIDVIGHERTAPDPDVDRARDGVVSRNLIYNITSRGNPAYGDEENSVY